MRDTVTEDRSRGPLLRLSKNYEKAPETEQQGVCAGDKESPARSIT